MPAATKSARRAAPIRITGAAWTGIRSEESPSPVSIIGERIVPIEIIIAKRFRNAVVNDIGATYRYFATRMLDRELATVMIVSRVEFARSHAVESIAGCIAP